MMNSERFESSYNYKIEKRIIYLLDEIDKYKEEYLLEKFRYRLASSEELRDKNNYLIKEKALLKNYRSDFRDKIHILKNQYKDAIRQINENYYLDIKEQKENIILIMAKIDATYKKMLAEYNNRNDLNYQKVNDFKSDFKAFREKEVIKLNHETEQNISSLKTKRLNDIATVNDNFQKNKNELRLNHDKSKFKEFKNEKRINIKRIKYEIALLKKESLQKDKLNKQEILSKKHKYYDTQIKNNKLIKEIKKQDRIFYSTLNNSDKILYDNFQTLVKQDYKSRRLEKADAFEKKIFKKLNTAYIYIFPAAFGEIVFTVLPFIFMIIACFFRVDLAKLSNSKFVSLQNFIDNFKYDTEFQKAIGNTIIYAFITIVLLTIVTVLMAAWLAKDTKIHNLTQTMVFTPHIASLVSISILWIAMLNPSGIINKALELFGIEGPGWLVQENTSLLSVSMVTVWKDIGYYVLIIISGLQGIPAYVYEAAKLDKSSKTNSFFKLTIPLLTPTLSFMFITKFISSFKVFAPIEIMTNGGPMGSSMVLSYWIYKVGRLGYNYGHAMAGAIVLTLLIAVCTFINYQFLKKKTVYY